MFVFFVGDEIPKTTFVKIVALTIIYMVMGVVFKLQFGLALV